MTQIEFCCKRCGGSLTFETCWGCGGEGVSGHDCGEDTCVCLDQSDNMECEECGGSGTFAMCMNSDEYCEANPMPGRSHIDRHTPEQYEYELQERVA